MTMNSGKTTLDRLQIGKNRHKEDGDAKEAIEG
jgi:hypothetical protein